VPIPRSSEGKPLHNPCIHQGNCCFYIQLIYFVAMDWYRSKLILETEDPSNFQPIFDKWEEITESRSLLQAFLPLSDGGTRLYEWGCCSQEDSLSPEGFFENVGQNELPVNTRKLEATFTTKLFNPYIGYRRLSYALQGILVTLFDPDLTKENWLMSFKDGEIVTQTPMGDLTVYHFPYFAEYDPTKFKVLFPWMPISEEEAASETYQTYYYYDIANGRIRYIDKTTCTTEKTQ